MCIRDSHETLRGHRVGERSELRIADQRYNCPRVRGVLHEVRVPLGACLREEQALYEVGRDRFSYRLRPLGEELLSGTPSLQRRQPSSRPESSRVCRSGRLGGCGRIRPPRHEIRQAAVADAASFAAFTSAEKAFGSLTASSARILRSTSMPAALSPEMKRL